MFRTSCARAARASQGESNNLVNILPNLRFSSNFKRRLNAVTKTANNYASHPLLDSFGRFHDYLRVSLTDRCNLRCDYCMPANGVKLNPDENLLSTEELLLAIRVFVDLGVRKVRLTGGEPTLRKDIVSLSSHIKDLGVETLAITTNGLLLSRLAPQLKAAGVSHLNLSLDTLDPMRFEKITKRRGHYLVMTGLDMALKQQFKSIKINCVVQRGVNQDELPAFVQLTKSLPIEIRFLEHMPFTQNNWDRTSLVTYEEMVHTIKECFPSFSKIPEDDHDAHSTARMWHVPSFKGRIGFMTTMTDEFCSSCNRLRLTADGNIKACLFNNSEVSIRDALRRPGASAADIVGIITEAVKAKKEKLGGFESSSQLVNATNRPMVLIGG